MSIISKQDTNGVKPLLQVGELGYDNYPAGGDKGRVFVGTGAENIGLAKKTEVVAVDGKADAHIARVDNPHAVTKAQVGLGNADDTADVDKNVLSATKLTTPRNITISGEVAGSASFDGSANINISTTIQPNSVALGTDTTGNYVDSVIAGEGITVTGVVGEGGTPSIAIAPVGTSGTYTKVSTNDKGQVVSGESLTANDIPNLDASKITSGIIDAARLPAYVDDVLEYANLAGFPATGEAGKIYIAMGTNKTYRWSGSTYVYITSGAVDSVAGKTGVVTLAKADVGLTNVDNTSDINKPISTATQNALNLKVDKVSGKGLSTEDYTTAEKTKLSVLSNYTLPISSTTVLGGVKAGDTVTIDVNGVLNVSGAVTSVTSVAGKTGVVTLNKNDVGLDEVDNTSDVNKPISTATQTALNTKVALAGNQTIAGVKTFTSSPIVPTPTTDFQVATKKYVDDEVTGANNYTDTRVNEVAGHLNTDYYQGPYGISWDYATDTYIRTGAKGYTSIQSMMRRCVLNADGTVNYYLHPDKSNFKEDGTPSILTGADGNVMVEIPKHYIKVETVGNVDRFSVSLTPEPGYVLDPSFMKWNGTKMVEVPYRYFRAYEGFVSNGKLLSISGVTPTKTQTIATFRTQAMANGAGWHLTDWNLLNTIKRLCYIEFCNFIVTEYLGNGNDTGGDYGITTGQSNALGNRSSNSTHNDKYMSYRGIENMYADIWEFVDGININNYQAYVNQKWSTFASDVFSGDYVAKGPLISAAASSSLIKRCNVSADGGFIPTTIGGSTTAFYGDALWSATGDKIAIYGGDAYYGASVGWVRWL